MAAKPQAKRRPYGPGDNPITSREEDRLDFMVYVPGLCNLLETSDTPYAIGIFGDWGMGKTSMMRLIREEMDARGHVTVWFNPWKYDGREDVRKALIRSCHATLKAKLKFFSFSVRHTVGVLRRGAIQIANMLGRCATVGEVGSEIETILSLDPRFKHVIEDKFSDLIRDIASETGRHRLRSHPAGNRLVILVDDLDRCAPETVTECIEAIKLFFDFQGCVFVIGASQDSLRVGFEHKYRAWSADGPGGESKRGAPVIEAQEYLKKIIQLPFYLRNPEPEIVREFLGEYAEDLGSIPALHEGAEGSDEVGEVRRVFLDLAERATALNLREIKRFVGTHALLLGVAERVSERQSLPAFEPNKIAKVLMLQFAFPEAYDYFHRYPEVLDEAQVCALLPPEERGTEAEGVPDAVWWRMREREAERAPSIVRDPRLLLALGCEPPLLGADAERYVRLSGHIVSEETAPRVSPGGRGLLVDMLSGDIGVIDAAVRALKQTAPDKLDMPLHFLTDALRAKDPAERWSATMALGTLGHAGALEPLLDVLSDDAEDSHVRATAARALAQLGLPQAIPRLSDILAARAASPHVRASAAAALGQPGAPRVVSPLLAVVSDLADDPYVRATATAALGRLGSTEAVAALIGNLQDDDSSVSGSAAWALGEIGDKSATGPLIRVLQDTKAWSSLRERAAVALGGLGDPDAVRALVVALKDRNPRLRVNAAWALGRFRTEEAVAALRDAADNDDDGLVRRTARAGAEGRVSGQPPTLPEAPWTWRPARPEKAGPP